MVFGGGPAGDSVGARGITAHLSVELARRYGCALELVGRSPEPDAEDPATASAVEPRELKLRLIELNRDARPAEKAFTKASARVAKEANKATKKAAKKDKDVRGKKDAIAVPKAKARRPRAKHAKKSASPPVVTGTG